MKYKKFFIKSMTDLQQTDMIYYIRNLKKYPLSKIEKTQLELYKNTNDINILLEINNVDKFVECLNLIWINSWNKLDTELSSDNPKIFQNKLAKYLDRIYNDYINSKNNQEFQNIFDVFN